MTQKIILFYNTMFGNPLNVPESIPDDFYITTDRKYMYLAHAVVFHIPNLKAIPYEHKPKNQLWIAWSMESDINYPCLKRKAFMRWFDLKMTYHIDSDIPVPYLDGITRENLGQIPFEKPFNINAFISSPFNRSGRLEYLKELMSCIKIDSYGKVLNNKTIINDNGISTKKELVSKYKFTIAFENSISDDYVTEKFFQPLCSGSVPIYLGAPNVNEFAPGAKSYIDINDFDSPMELATYLKKLCSNKILYEEYMRWKNEPFSEKFESLLTIAEEHFVIRLCKKVNDRLSVYNRTLDNVD